MSLQKRSRLHKLLLTFDEVGTYVTGEALFQEGAWNTETAAWEGSPHDTEYPLQNMTPDGKKLLNDVIGVAATKALETAAVAAEVATRAKESGAQALAQLTKLSADLKDAIGARDNFAALEKNARGLLTEATGYGDDQFQARHVAEVRLRKIPRLIRRMFGAI